MKQMLLHQMFLKILLAFLVQQLLIVYLVAILFMVIQKKIL